MSFWRQLRWQLFISYLAVIVVGITVVLVATNYFAPNYFFPMMRQMMGSTNGGAMDQMMGRMMGRAGGMMGQWMDDAIRQSFHLALQQALFWAGLAALLTAMAASLVISRRIVAPLYRMMDVTRRLAAGQYGERVQELGRDEMGDLGRSFNRMAEALQQGEEMRQELVANVAHELRTPLAAIKGYIEGLMDGVMPASTDTYGIIYREADRLHHLVEDLQELSQVEAGQVRLTLAPLDPGALVWEGIEKLRPQYAAKNVAVESRLLSTLPPVLADEHRIGQVLLNLLDNALQYTPSGGSVTVEARQQDKAVAISVRDTGIGIPPEHLPHIFTRFYRVDKSRSRAGGGSGIGLTIAKHLVEAHGGTITAASQPGSGSTFTFTLPLAS